MNTVPSRVGFIDIETFPYHGLAWNKYDTTLMNITSGGEVASVAYKIMGEKTTKVLALCDYDDYVAGSKDDTRLLTDLHKILSSLDYVIAHNGDNFDIKMIRTRILKLDLPPLPPIKTIDTLKVSRRLFRFPSNKLDDLCQELGIGKKVRHAGLEMWDACERGDMKEWAMMKKYNKHDVAPLLEQLYYRIRPHMTNHPNFSKQFIQGQHPPCPTCGAKNTAFNKYIYNLTSVRRQFQCRVCSLYFSTVLPKSEWNDTVKNRLSRFG
jgi:uncharacterized protein YprB with RNaseH-like and TPR domain